MPKPTEKNARALALDALLRIEESGSYANLALDAIIRQSTLSDADRRLFTVLVYGVTERRLTLDHYITQLSSRPLDALDPTVRCILRLGLYQLIYLDRVPPHAAVSESVALASRKTAGFVNACLRGYLRRRSALSLPDAESDPQGYLSVACSVPPPLAGRFLDEFGFARAAAILSAFHAHTPLTIALNPMRAGDRESYLGRLRENRIEAYPTPYAPLGIVISSPLPVESLPGFSEGAFFVQDEASQICVAALDAHPGETVIDACSCPGSKSFGAAIGMKNRGKVLSFDLHENKLSLVRKSAERLGLDIITAAVKDGKTFDKALEAVADRVLCDVPCSGFGVMGKKPDIRYKDPESANRLPEIQYAILENCARYVKPGGLLVYSTCTVFASENRENPLRFAAEHPDFILEDFDVGGLRSENGMLSLFPDTHHTDGFFIARLRRKTEGGDPA